MDNQSSPPRDRWRSLKEEMRVTTSLVMIMALSGYVQASEPFAPKLGEEWVAVDANDFKAKHADWDLRIWRHKKNGNLVTVARDPISRQLDSWGDLDRAMDFSTSAYPEWIPGNDFRTWRSKDFDFEPRFIKLQRSKVAIEKAEIPAVEYSVINDNDHVPMMANGFVVKLEKGTYYVQLTSIRPISDMIPRDLVRQLHEHDGSQ